MRVPINQAKVKKFLPLAGGLILLITLALFVANPILTLLSFRQVGEGQLYTMTYRGNYGFLPKSHSSLLKSYRKNFSQVSAFAHNATLDSALFKAKGKDGETIIGRNLDDYHLGPTLILLTNPRRGHASVTLLNLAYLGITDPSKLTLRDRLTLLLTPTLPFDGMNEHGLIVAFSSVDSSIVPHQPKQKTITGFYALRLILDQARTTSEAVEILGKFNIEFAPWPHLHYLIADASGDSVIVEFMDNKMVVTPNEQQPFQVMTHFYLADHPAQPDLNWRGDLLEKELGQRNGQLTDEEALELLELASIPNKSRWSTVYNTLTKEVSLIIRSRENSFHRLKLKK